MLESINLSNYRCFLRHEVPFANLNVVVGANNAGKSTLVEAIRVLNLVAGRFKNLNYVRPPEWTNEPAKCRGVIPAAHELDFRGGSVFHRYGDPPAKVTATFSNGAIVEAFVGPNESVYGQVRTSDGECVQSRAAARGVDVPTIAILPQIGPLAEGERKLSREHVLRSHDSRLASNHFRNQLHLWNSEHWSAFVAQAEASWPHLHIQDLYEDDDKLHLHVRDKDFVAEVGWMGHGLQMWLQVMWFLARNATVPVVILDEPDVYMHADLQRRLVRLLRNRLGQTIIATHSVEIISEVPPESILIVDKNRAKSSFAASLPAVQLAIDKMGGVHNIQLARLWNSRRCLHVEGKDVSMLKALQDTMFPTSELPFDLIPRLSIGGRGGWHWAIGSAMQLKNAAGEDIVSYCLMDSDYQTAGQLASLHEEANRHGIRLHVWWKKEIENYFLHSRAISRIIARDSDLENLSVVDEIEMQLDKITAGLKDATFDAMANDLFASNRSGGISTANRLARERLDSQWQSRDGRLSIVSGKAALAQLSQWCKQKYGVSFGPHRVARELQVSEIPGEMRAVIRAIESSEQFPKAHAIPDWAKPSESGARERERRARR